MTFHMTNKVLCTLLSLAVLFGPLNAAASEITFVHPDHLGSPVAYTDINANLVGQEFYTPYGETLNGSSDDDISFTGHYKDAGTGLIYAQARYYDPVVGRFLSVDPVTFSPDKPQQFNRYWYANGNPYLYTDPDGEHPLIFGVAGFVGDIGVQMLVEGRSWENVNLGRSALVGVTAATGGLLTGLLAAEATTVVGATAVTVAGNGLTGMASASAASVSEGGRISDGITVENAAGGIVGGRVGASAGGETVESAMQGEIVGEAVSQIGNLMEGISQDINGKQTDITEILNSEEYTMEKTK